MNGMMNSFILLNGTMRRLAEQGYNYYIDLDKLHKEGKLDSILEENLFMKVLKDDITDYLDNLFDNIPYHYFKKMKMEKITKDKLQLSSYYALALYCNNKLAYRNLPLILKSLIDKLEITKYQYLTLEDITSKIYETYDIDCENDPNLHQWVCEIYHKKENNKYYTYDKTYNYGYTHPTITEEFSVWAEHRTYDDELINLQNTAYKGSSIWVARSYGDGYGFDVLSIDSNTGKEKLIEVKSGLYFGFSLTENEVKVMKNCKYKNAEYYIYKYTYHSDENKVYPTIYKYDPELDLIVDINTNECYDLNPYTTQNERHEYENRYSIIKAETKQKTLN